jgi:hypothetical protein
VAEQFERFRVLEHFQSPPKSAAAFAAEETVEEAERRVVTLQRSQQRMREAMAVMLVSLRGDLQTISLSFSAFALDLATSPRRTPGRTPPAARSGAPSADATPPGGLFTPSYGALRPKPSAPGTPPSRYYTPDPASGLPSPGPRSRDGGELPRFGTASRIVPSSVSPAGSDPSPQAGWRVRRTADSAGVLDPEPSGVARRVRELEAERAVLQERLSAVNSRSVSAELSAASQAVGLSARLQAANQDKRNLLSANKELLARAGALERHLADGRAVSDALRSELAAQRDRCARAEKREGELRNSLWSLQNQAPRPPARPPARPPECAALLGCAARATSPPRLLPGPRGTALCAASWRRSA